jgi:zinc finger protein
MQSICPVCKKAGLKMTSNTHNIPYFEEVMETLTKCNSCGYRHVDVLVLGEKEPVIYTLKIDSKEDMHARVVRSGRSIVEVPELGVKITPGPDAEGYISNVEGVLKRIEDVIRMHPVSENSKDLLQKINRAKEGKETLHLKIEDPSGNSVIISKKAQKEDIK